MVRNKHTPGASVVDLWERKRKRGIPTWNNGKRWLARAQTKPGVARYRTRAHATEQDAWQWAEDTVARYRLRLDSGQRCTLRGLYDEYIEHLEGVGVSPDHLMKAKWVLGMLMEAGINDLKDDRLASKVEGFFRTLKVQMKTQKGMVKRRIEKDTSPRTKNAYMSHIMALCSYATRRRYLPYDPLAGVIQRFKEPKHTKPVFTLAELAVLTSDKHRDERFWLPFMLSLYGGFRIGECMHLRWENCLWQEKRFLVKNMPEHYRLKGQKERHTILQDEIAEILKPMAKPFGWIVPDKMRTGKNMWSWHFRHLLKTCEIERRGRSPHSIRHTWAALSVASGRDPFDVMGLAGHQSLNTTLRYAQAAGVYRDAVSGWPKGQFRLRNTPPCGVRPEISELPTLGGSHLA